jgi:Uncharacterised nucleotidyltransferase
MLSLWETHHVTGKKRGAAATLRKVLASARRARVDDLVLIGAGALSAYGAPRYSEDLDFLLPHEQAKRLARSLIDAGFKGPPPSTHVYLYTYSSRGGVDVDIMGATEQLYLDAIASAAPATFLGVEVKVPSPNFFALLKLRAAEGNPERELRHLGDIQDLARVRRLRLEFARTYVRLNEPDLKPFLARLEASLARAKK